LDAGCRGRDCVGAVQLLPPDETHQNGIDQRARRISDAEAKKLSDYVAQHFKDQKANPGSEASVRHQIEALQRRQPDLSQFTPALAEIARPQMLHAEDLIASLASLKSVDFKSVGPGGADIYTVKFEHGSPIPVLPACAVISTKSRAHSN
jgi:hypothetical protein